MKAAIFVALACIMTLQLTSTSALSILTSPLKSIDQKPIGVPPVPLTGKVARSLPSGVTGNVFKTVTNGTQRQTEDLHKGSGAIFNTNEAPEGANVDSKIVA